MEVQLQWFAAYREATGVARETVQTEAATAGDLFAEMTSRHPALLGRDGSLVAINDEMADWDSVLADGDRVLFFPPVAGG